MSSESLGDLAATINKEHRLTYDSALSMLDHAIQCGESLIAARTFVPNGQWTKWIESNLDMHPVAVNRYMRIASYKNELLSAEHRPDSINAAMTYLRNIEAPALPRNSHGRQPTFDVNEAERLSKLGMSYKDIGEVMGVSDVAIRRQLAPDATRKAVALTIRARTQKRAEQRAREDGRLIARVVHAGGKPAEAYILLRRCAVVLEQALADAETETGRTGFENALLYAHRAEDAITRALDINHHRRHTRKGSS